MAVGNRDQIVAGVRQSKSISTLLCFVRQCLTSDGRHAATDFELLMQAGSYEIGTFLTFHSPSGYYDRRYSGRRRSRLVFIRR